RLRRNTPMADDRPAPDRPTLQRVLLGKGSDDEQARVEELLQGSPEGLVAVRELSAEDSLVLVLHGAPGPEEVAEAPFERALIDKLQQLPRPAGDPSPGDPASADCSFLAPSQRPDELGRLGGYRVLRLRGAGGMGMVFEAEDPALQRRVALKVMRPGMALPSTARQRFLQEGRAAARLEHEHVVTIHHVGEERGVPYLVMPLLAGESLHDRLQRQRLLPLADVLRFGRELAAALAAAHARGLIHRDVKPANVWLEERPAEPPPSDGEPGGVPAMGAAPSYRIKVLDFGLVYQPEARAASERLTLTGSVVGTPAYMAPEQAVGKVVDARADLFSLGCVLYQMTTGERAFTGDNTVAVLRAAAE